MTMINVIILYRETQYITFVKSEAQYYKYIYNNYATVSHNSPKTNILLKKIACVHVQLVCHAWDD